MDGAPLVGHLSEDADLGRPFERVGNREDNGCYAVTALRTVVLLFFISARAASNQPR
jgi:hypothetical protein